MGALIFCHEHFHLKSSYKGRGKVYSVGYKNKKSYGFVKLLHAYCGLSGPALLWRAEQETFFQLFHYVGRLQIF